MRTDFSRLMMTLIPPRVTKVGLLSVLPVVTGITLITFPSRRTVSVSLATSTVLICAWPMVKLLVTVRRPHTPEESSTPPMAAVTLTLVPLGQYFSGRHCTSLELSQRQAPLTLGVDDTVSALSAASL